MKRTDYVRDLIRTRQRATSLYLKLAFHHLIAYPPYRPYLAFEIMGKVYQKKAIPFGILHSKIFFVQTLVTVLTKILEGFGRIIAQEKYENESKQLLNFQGCAGDLERMYLKMTNPRRQELSFQLKRFINQILKSVPNQDQIQESKKKKTELIAEYINEKRINDIRREKC
ncbi:MAG: hypothetical protein EZS28_014488 [Streblomastix strix]|uniref:Uncharacterized protein n=1 Tax=Streblomastix strix TaxID=222440 RepID=A0A5J4W4X5_9EUKA|nr:MAG: hypothetical protein EZS28_014488 [Streblomastix strix]